MGRGKICTRSPPWLLQKRAIQDPSRREGGETEGHRASPEGSRADQSRCAAVDAPVRAKVERSWDRGLRNVLALEFSVVRVSKGIWLPFSGCRF